MLPEYGTTEFTKELNEILRSNSKHRHDFYHETCEHAEAMGVHVEGLKPKKLLDINRPNEPGDIKAYRLEVYRPKTKSLSEKVINTVNRIFNPRLYHITWYPSPTPVIRDEEWIDKYLTEELPYYESLMRFVRETYTKKDFADPNALCAILPINFDIPDTEYYKPVPYIYGAHEILKFKESEYYLIKCKGKGKELGKAIWMDRERVAFYKEIEKDNWQLKIEYPHTLREVPAFRLGGLIMGNEAPYWFQSFIAGVLPHWDDVVTLSSDLQAGVVNHLYLEKWEYTVECDSCDGNGYMSVQDANPTADVKNLLPPGAEARVTCKTCGGSGKRVTRGPFNVTQINKDAMASEVVSPIPPAGYIDKPIDILDKIIEIIVKEETKGLASINMEIISKVGEDQSGVAKTIDRQDLDGFLMRYATHAFDYVIPQLVWYCMKWRYGNILTDDQLIENFPTVKKPTKFEVIDVMLLQQEMKAASEANVSSNILKQIEKEIVNTKYSGDEFERKKNNAIIELDPLYSKGPDELMTLMASNVIKKEDWAVHEYIDLAIDTLTENDEAFLDLSRRQQRELVNIWVKNYLDMNPKPVEVGDDGEEVPERTDIEAEARAKLKGSVGGTQGILQIQESVSRGITQYSAAVTLLKEIYGFDDKVAKAILGTPKKQVASVAPVQVQI